LLGGSLRRERGAAEAGFVGADVEVGLVEGQGLNHIAVAGKDRMDLSRYLAVDIEARLHEQQSDSAGAP
jgi:hypothetical protein